jgi:hypothetical protein
MRWLRFGLETLGLMLLPTAAGLGLIVGLWFRVFGRLPTASEVWGVVVSLAEIVAEGVMG